jgi:hypothetical protein
MSVSSSRKLVILVNVRACNACIAKAGGTCGDPCPCPADGTSAINHAGRGDCPWGRHLSASATGTLPTPESPGAVPGMDVAGPKLWAEMHTKTDADAAYVKSVTRRLPCGECKSWFVAYLKEHPPRFDDWFRWTWECHQAANAKLGKPLLTIDEARARWQSP